MYFDDNDDSDMNFMKLMIKCIERRNDSETLKSIIEYPSISFLLL